MRFLTGPLVVCSACVPAVSAQQILEIDMDAGRELAGGPAYVFDDRAASMDYGRRLVLVPEIVDPMVVRAYSLEDGSVESLFGKPRRGDGPGELTQMYRTATGPDGVFMSGPGRVLYWSWSGALLHQWTPTAPLTHRLCSLDGRPAVALEEGVVFRGDDGESIALGGEARTWLKTTPASHEASVDAYMSVKLACAGSSAYVLVGADHALTEYRMDAEPRTIPMPAELVKAASKMRDFPARQWGYGNMFLDDDGRLVITRVTDVDDLIGAVVDPETGCYALLKQRPPGDFPIYVGMFADSMVMLEKSQEPTVKMINGRRVSVYSSDKSYMFVRPARPVSGEPCS